MFKFLKQFFTFLCPIIRQTLIQTLADELGKIAYPNRKRTSYATARQRGTGRTASVPYSEMSANKAFHDVLMVAFDLTGPNAELTYQWLMDQMPMPNANGYLKSEVVLDSWWVADDNRLDLSDTDSAVFVTRGKQEEARALLREHGLVE